MTNIRKLQEVASKVFLYDYKSREELVLKTDAACERPLYVYLCGNEEFLLYSHSIENLLSDVRVNDQISEQGISMLLQSGVIPPPRTIYEYIYVLGVGDTLSLGTDVIRKKIRVIFNHRFPFVSGSGERAELNHEVKNKILSLLCEAVYANLDKRKDTLLFHSAGKDSNSIALALAESGNNENVTLITQRSKAGADESVISKKIAKKLGFNHVVFNEAGRLTESEKSYILDYFKSIPFPTVDSVSLAYPLYASQLPSLFDSNLIDGGGNDVYMYTPLSRREKVTFPASAVISRLSKIREVVPTESRLNSYSKTRAERCGAGGLSYRDSKRVFQNSINAYNVWSLREQSSEKLSDIEFKTDILTTVIAAEQHIRKFRNFASYCSSNPILPWANESVANYISSLPKEMLYDEKKCKNKIILRELLNERLGLDSDRIGKMGFTFNFRDLLVENWSWFSSQVYDCTFWTYEVKELLGRLYRQMSRDTKNSTECAKIINQIVCLSMWLNARG